MTPTLFSAWEQAAGLGGTPRWLLGPPLGFGANLPPLLLSLAAAAMVFLGVRSFCAAPTRARWSLLAGLAAVALLGVTPPFIPLLILWAAISIGWNAAVSREPLVRAAGAVLAFAVAFPLSAVWWLPAVALWSARAPDPRFNSRWLISIERMVTDVQGRWLTTPLARFASTTGEPRIFPVEAYRRPSEALPEQALLGTVADFTRIAVIDHIPPKIQRMSEGRVTTAPEWTRVEPARLEKLTRAGDVAAVKVHSSSWTLVVSNVPWWPGWRIYWNGERMPPIRVNGAFVGTFVPPGDGTLELRYRPDELSQAFRLTVSGFLVAVVLLVFPIYRRAGQWAELVHEAAHRGMDRSRRAGQRIAAAIRRLRARRPIRSAMLLAIQHRHRLFAVTVLATLLGYSGMVIAFRVRNAGGADSSGYLNEARMWRKGELIAPLEMPKEMGIPVSLARHFAPLGFTTGPRPYTMVPTYPPGLPMHMALATTAAGEDAAFLVGPFAAIAAIVLLYLLARDFGLPRPWSAAAAAGLATCAVFLFQSVQPVSDVLATAWAIASIALARRAGRASSWSVAAGLAFGVAVLVRPTNALLLPALLVASGLRARVLVGIALGGVVPAVVHFAVNQLIFSNPMASGYGDIRELTSWRYFFPRLAHYSWWLCVQLSPVVFPAAIAVLAVRKVARRDRLLLAAWFVPFLSFYCFYSVYEEWWYTRFLLPAIPALLLACAVGLHGLVAEWRPAKAAVVATAILIAVLANEIAVSAHFSVLDDAKAEAVYLQASRGAAAILPLNAVVVGMQMSGALYYYTGRTMVRWDSIQPDEFQALRAYVGSRPWYALLADFESEEAMRHTGAAWVPSARFDSVVLYRLDEGGARGGNSANAPQ